LGVLLSFIHREIVTILLAVLVCTSIPSLILGQSNRDWNQTEALEIIRRGQELRSQIAIDSLFRDYQAEAAGHVYFFADGIRPEDRILIKADQVALDVFWSAPDNTKQIIVGQRDEKMLPTNIQYHLDHLTVIQDDFGSSFYLGGGDEIEGVVHPLSANSTDTYDFQISDSISISLPSSKDIKVYQLKVRPKNLDNPGVTGSLHLQDVTGAIVHMSLTFTPSSYIDESLDYIRIITDNSMWNGRHWLPYDQKIVIRRESTLLDLPIGTTIQTHFRIRNYKFNQNFPSNFFSGSSIVSLPFSEKSQHIFASGLLEGLSEANYTSSVDMDQVRKMALELSGTKSLTKWKQSRLFLPTLSSMYRRNRAEGSFFGVGNSLQIRPGWKLQSNVGYAKGSKSLVLSSTLRKEQTRGYFSFQAFRKQLNDIGVMLPGSSGAMNSLASALIQQDYSDPYFSSGIKANQSWSIGSNHSIKISGAWERHWSAENIMEGYPAESGLNRKIRPINEGNHQYLEFTYANMTSGTGLLTTFISRVGNINEDLYTNIYTDIQAQKHLPKMKTNVKTSLRAGLSEGTNSPQFQYLIGGRHTLPGYNYRSFGGHRFALLTGEIDRSIWSPWLTLRIFGSTGMTGDLYSPITANELTSSSDLFKDTTTNGLQTSIGMGLGFGWDLLHLNVGRGVNQGGKWEFTIAADHRFWDWL